MGIDVSLCQFVQIAVSQHIPTQCGELLVEFLNALGVCLPLAFRLTLRAQRCPRGIAENHIEPAVKLWVWQRAKATRDKAPPPSDVCGRVVEVVQHTPL